MNILKRKSFSKHFTQAYLYVCFMLLIILISISKKNLKFSGSNIFRILQRILQTKYGCWILIFFLKLNWSQNIYKFESIVFLIAFFRENALKHSIFPVDEKIRK